MSNYESKWIRVKLTIAVGNESKILIANIATPTNNQGIINPFMTHNPKTDQLSEKDFIYMTDDNGKYMGTIRASNVICIEQICY